MTVLPEKLKAKGHTAKRDKGKDTSSKSFTVPLIIVHPLIFQCGMISHQSQVQTSAWSDKEEGNPCDYVRGCIFTAWTPS